MRKFEELSNEEQRETLEQLKQFNLELLLDHTVIVWSNPNVKQPLNSGSRPAPTDRLRNG
jgi:hypothetical protein